MLYSHLIFIVSRPMSKETIKMGSFISQSVRLPICSPIDTLGVLYERNSYSFS